MKLLRFGPAGFEKPGLLDADSQIRDLSGVIGQLDAEQLSPAQLKKLHGIAVGALPVVSGSPRLGTPYQGIGKFIAVGLNFSDHAAEAGMPVPSEPVIFMKATSCIIGPNDAVMLPKDSQKTDWEVELAIVVGREARDISAAEAADHIFGYVCVNDISDRTTQVDEEEIGRAHV